MLYNFTVYSIKIFFLGVLGVKHPEDRLQKEPERNGSGLYAH